MRTIVRLGRLSLVVVVLIWTTVSFDFLMVEATTAADTTTGAAAAAVVAAMIAVAKENNSQSCDCTIGSLREIESLHQDWSRLRLENPNGQTKYPTNNENLTVGCQTLAVYEKELDSDGINIF